MEEEEEEEEEEGSSIPNTFVEINKHKMVECLCRNKQHKDTKMVNR